MEYLRELQLTELEILNEIHRICIKNGLVYYLIGGTLLGAVRHKGFIPWDDDLDIAMPRYDYERFLDICENELNENYYLHCIRTDSKYWLPFAKVRKKNTLFDEANISKLNVKKGIYVDIFPLDKEFCENSREKAFRTKIIKNLSAVLLDKINFYNNGSKTFKLKLVRIIFYAFSSKSIQNLQTKLMSKNNRKDCEYYVNYGSNYNTVKQTSPQSKYNPPVMLEFEGGQYYAPNDYAYLLERIYGKDYMSLPPVEKRITHKPVRICFNTNESIYQEKNNEKI